MRNQMFRYQTQRIDMAHSNVAATTTDHLNMTDASTTKYSIFEKAGGPQATSDSSFFFFEKAQNSIIQKVDRILSKTSQRESIVMEIHVNRY